MRTITDYTELRKIQMDILSYVDKVCHEQNIKYSISGGTLIGAVRHKGFIPWDDDIDIMLTRQEYDKLVKALSGDYEDSKPYKILTHSISKDFQFPYAKIVDERTILRENVKGCKDFGVFVDVFPIDYIPKSGVNLLFSRMRFLYNILILKRLTTNRKRSFLKNATIKLSQIILAPVSSDRILDKMDAIARKAGRQTTDKMACLVWGYGKKEIIPAGVHQKHCMLPFEDRTYMAIADYNTYLTNLYGDYMKLPPKDKQISHHDFEVYWKD